MDQRGHGQKYPPVVSLFSLLLWIPGPVGGAQSLSLYERGTESPVASTGTGFGRGRQDHDGRTVLGVTIVVVVSMILLQHWSSSCRHGWCIREAPVVVLGFGTQRGCLPSFILGTFSLLGGVVMDVGDESGGAIRMVIGSRICIGAIVVPNVGGIQLYQLGQGNGVKKFHMAALFLIGLHQSSFQDPTGIPSGLWTFPTPGRTEQGPPVPHTGTTPGCGWNKRRRRKGSCQVSTH